MAVMQGSSQQKQQERCTYQQEAKAREQAALPSMGLSRVWLSIKATTGQGLIYWE